jgi:predicted anti-sigma-YlaC factor YlaD
MALPDLDDLIAEVDRTCATAHVGGREREQPDWLALLEVAARIGGELQALADDLVEDYVEHCRMHGYTWAEIGSVLGVTRQAAQQRFLSPHREYAPEEFTEELRRAMTAVKQVAIQHRNNYIGTEHLLWGISAEDNSAIRLLAELNVSVDELRRVLGSRLSMGASQAAERIAFTPYSRRAVAVAREYATRQDATGIGCDHLLIGLAQVGRGVATSVMKDVGVDLQALVAGPADRR